jgi:hypothetical protein
MPNDRHCRQRVALSEAQNRIIQELEPRSQSRKATPRNKRAIGRSLRRPVAAPKSALMERQFLGVA